MRKNNSLLFIILIFSSLLVIGCLNKVSEKPGQVTDSFSTNGITDSEIIIGSSSALTEHAGFLGTQYIHGSQAYINEINARGGINGKKSDS